MAADRSFGDVFVVSNLGQARHARAILESNAGTRPAAVAVLRTPTSAGLAAQLQRWLGDAGLQVVQVDLPAWPTAPRPWTVRRIAGVYGELARRHRAERLWLANVNAHYGVAALAYRRCGAAVCYYEEGLGTYRDEGDPAEAVGARDAERSWWSLVRSHVEWFRSHDRSLRALRRSVLAAGRDSSAWLADRLAGHRWYRAVVARTAGEAVARAFFEPVATFDRALVVFPDLLDPDRIDAREVESFRPPVFDDEVARARDLLARAGGAADGTLFLSQPYADRGERYYSAVAAELAAACTGPLVVVPHPRERYHHVEQLLRELGARRIDARSLDRDVLVGAEAVLSAGGFERCVGVTSSTLVYAPVIAPEVEVRSIGRGVVERLSNESTSVANIDRLRADVQLHDRVAAGLGPPPSGEPAERRGAAARVSDTRSV